MCPCTAREILNPWTTNLNRCLKTDSGKIGFVTFQQEVWSHWVLLDPDFGGGDLETGKAGILDGQRPWTFRHFTESLGAALPAQGLALKGKMVHAFLGQTFMKWQELWWAQPYCHHGTELVIITGLLYKPWNTDLHVSHMSSEQWYLSVWEWTGYRGSLSAGVHVGLMDSAPWHTAGPLNAEIRGSGLQICLWGVTLREWLLFFKERYITSKFTLHVNKLVKYISLYC